MNYKPQSLTASPRFTILIVVAALLTIAARHTLARSADEESVPAISAASDEKTTSSAADPSKAPTDEAPGSDPAIAGAEANSADVPASRELLTQVRSKLEGLDSLTCDLHETVLMSGRTLHAVGTYAEAAGNRIHVEFRIFPSQSSAKEDLRKLAIDAEPVVLAPETSRGELTQVSDGTVVFTHWKNGDNVSVTRRNLRDIMDAATKVADYDANHVAMDLGVGGLRGLISRIESLMEFAPVQTKELGKTKYYVVRGRWNAKSRKELFQLADDVIVDPRPHIPEYVVFYIDARTLLPRRIEYRKRAPDPAQKIDRPMVTLDLRNIALNVTIPDEKFVFKTPEGVKEEDVTEQTIQAIEQSVQNATGSTPPVP